MILRRTKFTAVLACALVATCRPGDAADPEHVSQWPLYQGGPGFSGHSPDESVKPPLKLVWSYRLDGDASGDAGGGVTVAGGLVYVNVLNTRSLLALDAHTGRLRWERSESYPGYRTVPSYSQGRLFLWDRFVARRPRVLALSATTGETLWEYALRPGYVSAVRGGLPVAGGKVYCSDGGQPPAVVALDEADGRVLWRTQFEAQDGPSITLPTVAEGRLFVALHSATRRGQRVDRGAVVALDADTGKLLWRHDALPADRPLFTDGRVLACTTWDDRKLKFQLLDAATGAEQWTFDKTFSVYTPPSASFHDKYVIIKPYGGSFYIVDRQTGQALRYFNGITNSGCGTPVIAGRYAFVGTGVFDGDLEAAKAFRLTDAPREAGRCSSLHAVDLETGKSAWFYGAGNTVCGDPAIAYGRLYFTSRDGRVYCFAPAGPDEPTTPEAVDRSEPASPDDVRALIDERPADGSVGDWPMQGRTPQRSGSAAALALPLEPAWQYALGDRVYCGATIAEGKVFAGSDAGKLTALRLATGERVWQFPAGGAIRCTPAVMGGQVYFGSNRGMFHALDTNTGKELWKFRCGGAVQASPAVVGGVVLFAASDHHVYALNRHNGRVLWRHRLPHYNIQATPVVHGQQVFVAAWHDWVCSLDLLTGREQWRTFIPVSIESLALYDNRLYARSANYLVEIEPSTGQRLRLAAIGYGYGGLAFLDQTVFCSGIRSQYGATGGMAIDLTSPGVDMKARVPDLAGIQLIRGKGMRGAPALASLATPLVIGNNVCFATQDGDVVITDAEGNRLWSHALPRTCHAAPVAGEGTLVVGCDDGCLYAFREEKR